MINPSVITVFDCSSCYWIPAQALCTYIVRMGNLTELAIQDTRVSLQNLPRVFEACQRIVKLGLSLSKQSLKQYIDIGEDSMADLMTNGFHRVTHLKVLTCLAPSRRNDVEPWLPTLRVLT